MSCAGPWPPSMRTNTTTAAISQPLPKAEIDMAALPSIKSPPCFPATARNPASPGVRESEGTTPRAKVQVGGLLDVIEQHLRDRRDRRSYLSRYLRGSAFEGPETWSEWQDLDLRPLVPNAMRSLAAFEKSAIFVTFEDVCLTFVARSAFSVFAVLYQPQRGM